MKIRIGSLGIGASVKEFEVSLTDAIGTFVAEAGQDLSSVVTVNGREVDVSKTFQQENIGAGSLLVVKATKKTSGAVDAEEVATLSPAERKALLDALLEKEAESTSPIEVMMPKILQGGARLTETTLVEPNTTILQFASNFADPSQIITIEKIDASGEYVPVTSPFQIVEANVQYVIKTR